MSANLLTAFQFIISLQGRVVSLEGNTTINIKMASSNYFRNLAGIEEMAIEGKEWVVSKKDLDAQSYGTPKRGDFIYDSDLGEDTIDEVKPLIILGQIAGYRIRTS